MHDVPADDHGNRFTGSQPESRCWPLSRMEHEQFQQHRRAMERNGQECSSAAFFCCQQPCRGRWSGLQWLLRVSLPLADALIEQQVLENCQEKLRLLARPFWESGYRRRVLSLRASI